MNGKGGLGGTDRLEPGKRLGGDRHLYHVQHRLVIARQPLACQVQGYSPNSLGGLPECAHRAHDGRPGRPDLAQLDRAARVRQPVRDHLRPVNGSHPLGDLPGIQQPGRPPMQIAAPGAKVHKRHHQSEPVGRRAPTRVDDLQQPLSKPHLRFMAAALA